MCRADFAPCARKNIPHAGARSFILNNSDHEEDEEDQDENSDEDEEEAGVDVWYS